MNQSPAEVSTQADRRSFRRILAIVGLTLAVLISLLTFPAALPWMIAAWLLWHTVIACRGQAGWIPLCLVLIILAVKRPYWSPPLIVLAIFSILVGGVNLLLTNRFATDRSKRWIWLGAGLLWSLWAITAVQWFRTSHCQRQLVLDPARPVVCIGDSLTSGVLPYGGYPADLEGLLAVPVINLGQAGITSEDALQLLPELLDANPQVVVIELGGHDFLRGRARSTTQSHLEQIIRASRSAGAEVVIMEIPRGFMVDPYSGLDRELARTHGLELISDSAIRSLVLWSPHAPPGMWTGGPHLSEDGLHPNAEGNQYLAQCVARALRRMYGDEIIREMHR
jgi:lysophospholipase L1-like esterase